MKSKNWYVRMAAVLALVLLGSLAQGAKDEPCYAMENNVEPRIYMPLAMDNSWTYIWQNKVISDEKAPNDQKKPTYYHFGFMKGGSFITGHYLYSLQTVKETYTVYRKDGNHFFFNTSCSGDVCKDHSFGDGRFDNSVENAWTWTDTAGSGQLNIVLSETINRQIIRGAPDSGVVEIHVDNRNIIHVVKKNKKWEYLAMGMAYGKHIEIFYEFIDQTIEVPAGKFDRCILVREIYTNDYDDRKVVFTVYRYYAPNVGKVKELQKLGDGTVTYTMELESFKVAK